MSEVKPARFSVRDSNGFIAIAESLLDSRSDEVYLVGIAEVERWTSSSMLDQSGLQLKREISKEMEEYNFHRNWIGYLGPYTKQDLITLLFGSKSILRFAALNEDPTSLFRRARKISVDKSVREVKPKIRKPARQYIKRDGYGNRKVYRKEASWMSETRKKQQRIAEDRASGLLTIAVMSQRLVASMPYLIRVIERLEMNRADYGTATFTNVEYEIIKQEVLSKRKR